jgi:hypothetical protein
MVRLPLGLHHLGVLLLRKVCLIVTYTELNTNMCFSSLFFWYLRITHMCSLLRFPNKRIFTNDLLRMVTKFRTQRNTYFSDVWWNVSRSGYKFVPLYLIINIFCTLPCHINLTQSWSVTCVSVVVCLPLSHSVTLPLSHSQTLPSPAHYSAICETDGWIYWTISENVTGSVLIDRDRDQNRALWIEWLTMFEPQRSRPSAVTHWQIVW